MKIKYKKLIFSFLPIALANILVFSGWFYLFSVIGAQKEKIAEARLNLALVEKKAADSKSLKSLMEDIAEKRGKIDDVFLNNETIIKFIKALENLSGQTGVFLKLNSINVGKDGGSGANFRFNVSGDFGGIFKYLELVENLPYKVSVKKSYIQLNEETSADSEQKNKARWSADFEIILNSFINDEKD
ncbi:MAG: hypothetical protein GXP44_00960 [bacterium]|nr:hypothetical protein [bacterium]